MLNWQGRRARKRLCALAALLSGTFAALPAALAGDAQQNARVFGAFGPEGLRMREQLWILPSGEPGRVLRATVFRPDDAAEPMLAADGRRPLVIINHGTSSATRLSVSMPVYYWMSRWFVDRGYVVVLPQRRGHGATGGALSESIGSCADPDHLRSGEIAADDIQSVVDYMAQEPFVAPRKTVVVGISTGGWAALALAARNPPDVAAVVNIAGGRGGYAGGKANAVCGEARLAQVAGIFGRTARIPTLWLYAENDTYFGPKLAARMADAWRAAGADAELHLLPSYGTEGHDIANDRAGWDVWGAATDAFLGNRQAPAVAGAPAMGEQMAGGVSELSPELATVRGDAR